MAQSIVAVDVDGVVADLHEEWLRRYNVDYNDRVLPQDVLSWNINEFIKPECGNKIFNYLANPDIYRLVKPIAGARTGVAMLRECGFRVIFLSACFTGTVDAKIKWLIRHGFLEERYMHKDFIACSDKHLIRAHTLIDDNPKNLREFAGKKLLFTQPWNQLHTEYDRINRWNEVLRLVR